MSRRRPHQPIFRKKIQHGAVTVGNTAAVPAEPVQMVVADARSASTADNIVLTQHQLLAVADATSAPAVDSVVLDLTLDLVVQDATSASAIDNLTLTQHQILVVQDAAAASTADNIALIQHQILTVADATSASTVDNLALGTQALAAAILAASPLGYWKLDETTGTTISDSSGNGRNGTISGTYTLAGQAGPGSAVGISFGGGVIDIADDDAWSLNTTPGLTVFALVYPSSTTAKGIIGKGVAGSLEWAATLSATNLRPVWQAFGPANAIRQSRSSTTDPVSTGAWSAIAFSTPNSGVQTTNCKVYNNDGTNVGNASGSTPAGSYSNQANSLLIGNANVPGTTTFAGGIAHVAVFAGQLSDAAVDAFMSAALADGWI